MSYKKHYNLYFIIFIISLLLRDILNIFNKSVLMPLLIIFFVPIIILILDIATQKRINRYILLQLFATLFYVIIMPYNDNGFKYFLPLLYSGYAFRKISFKYIAKYFLVIQIISLLFRYLLINNGIINENALNVSWKSDLGLMGHDLGYGNSNTAGMALFYLLCMLYVCIFNNNKKLSFCLISIGACFFYFYTFSRTALISSILLLFTYFIPSKLDFLFKKKIILFLPPILVLSPFLLYNYYIGLTEINSLFSNRFSYISYIIIHFIKDPFCFVTGIQLAEDIPIDNAFALMLTIGGIGAIAIFFWIYKDFLHNLSKTPTYIITLIVIIIISGIGESSWVAFGSIGSTFFWLMFLNKTYYSENMNYRYISNNKN